MRRDYASRMDFVLDRFDLAVESLEASQIELPELRERLPKGAKLPEFCGIKARETEVLSPYVSTSVVEQDANGGGRKDAVLIKGHAPR